MTKISRALISVSDKTGLIEFAQFLKRFDIEIISTGGTARVLNEAGISITPVSNVTKFPEMLDGRVKTLHPKIHGGILALRSKQDHVEQMSRHDIQPIDMVVVNLYPFEATTSDPNVSLEDAIENIDIGGPTLIRSAAKNHADVVVIVDPTYYSKVREAMESSNGDVSLELRRYLAVKAFQHTAYYDSLIYRFLENRFLDQSDDFPTKLVMGYRKKQELRYGENPHQKATFYEDPFPIGLVITAAKQHQGKDLSFNNYLDLDSALSIIQEFSEPAAVVIKHTNPCGTAVASSLKEAYVRARAGDPMSAFGSIVALNRDVDVDTAEEITSTFVECVIAPSFSIAALEAFKKKQNLRVLELPSISTMRKFEPVDYKNVKGGLLLQTRDTLEISATDLKVVTKMAPPEHVIPQLLFAWKVLKHVKSNAILLAKDFQVIGVGAGQMSRIDSVLIAIRKAADRVKGAVLASDAFFPFPDAIEAAKKAGIIAIIQPGGSIRDQEVIAAANEENIPMVFTGHRCFKH
ncbi:MAG: bifunctional phosphoribosylaminoimidazolecarboxamide formyltransferase/IMP cyclohydrolase [Candidatus Helarchaeota archaeon]